MCPKCNKEYLVSLREKEKKKIFNNMLKEGK